MMFVTELSDDFLYFVEWFRQHDDDYGPRVFVYWSQGMWNSFARFHVDTCEKVYEILCTYLCCILSMPSFSDFGAVAYGMASVSLDPNRWLFGHLIGKELPSDLCSCFFTEPSNLHICKRRVSHCKVAIRCPLVPETLGVSAQRFSHFFQRTLPIMALCSIY